MNPNAAPFAWLFDPVDAATFGREYFERATLHVSRNDPARFANLYGVGDLEDALQLGAREAANFALVKAGSPELAIEQYAPMRPSVRAAYTGKPPVTTIDPRKVAEFFEQGWTLVVKDASAFSARMQRFCNALQAQTGWFVQPNVYFTPASAQGFDVHYDTHGTLIAQIEGEKTWRVYKPVVELPLESQPFDAAAHADRLQLDCEIPMQPGDTLYIPHGFPHHAASRGTRTLHVTFAMLTLRVADLLERMLAAAALADVELRRSLPPGWRDDPATAGALMRSLNDRLREVFAHDRLGPSGDRLALEFLGASRIDASGSFARVRASKAIAATSTIRWRGDLPYAISERGEALALLVPGRSLTLPAACAQALRRLRQGPVTVGELPGLADVNQLWFARVLLTYGVVDVDGPA
ncbi:MAG TPA: cupin domain-containing protein [Candidatus Acidoferrales bacterium]|nr:cupin domain-containing protein [Candidatus Acidoferrales bacterium]